MSSEPTLLERARRGIVPLFVFGAIYYGVFGGEYSVFEVRSARAAVDVERVRLTEVEAEIDSLRAWADSLDSDLGTIERVARERFGMIREGETLYRFVLPDSTAAPEAPTPER